MNLKESIAEVLKLLPARSRDVLARRFGLGRNGLETLEAIGARYGVTRERVRQIESQALKGLASPGAKLIFTPFVKDARAYFERAGGLTREDVALGELARRWHDAENRAAFVIRVSRAFVFRPATPVRHALWAVAEGAVERAERFVEALVRRLGEERKLVAAADLSAYLAGVGREVFGETAVSTESLASYLATTRLIGQTPFGLWGLTRWPEVSPRGVRDYAYLVLRKLQKPLHFRTLAKEMDARLALERSAHEQTVHNELIKDPRFVLVGRGVYALKEWGYQPGTVRQVLATILAQNGGVMERDELMTEVKKQRLVKDNTVVLNLQNRRYFVRLADGRYALAKKGAVVERA